MQLRVTIVALGLTLLGAPAARAAEKCGPHQHVAVESNDEEGGTVKRCVCDEGWDAGGPGAPCRKVKPTGKPTPKKG
ncbi:MAG: hypothetical protein JWN44_4707 [Myxococcales bacterium]|nr:hypothetical protein [Myxococcales bacterium]